MHEPETATDALHSVNRCLEAFHGESNNRAQAFLAELPILSDPAKIHAYLACIGKAMALGIIDLVDLGRYCHLAEMAIRAWKLAHPLPTKGNPQGDEKRSDAPDPTLLGTGKGCQTVNQPSSEPKNPPLPPNGNHSETDHNRIAAALLPDFDTQKAMYKSLRAQGILLPSNSHLRKNPVEALYFCGMAGLKVDKQPPAQANQAA